MERGKLDEVDWKGEERKRIEREERLRRKGKGRREFAIKLEREGGDRGREREKQVI